MSDPISRVAEPSSPDYAAAWEEWTAEDGVWDEAVGDGLATDVR